MTRIALYALGSHFGIDRLAWSVLDYLDTQPSGATDYWSTQCLSGCEGLLSEWNQTSERNAMVVDTLIDHRAKPFSLKRLTPTQLACTSGLLSGHSLSLSETLTMADTLGILPTNLIVCGICVPEAQMPHPSERVVAQIAATLRQYFQSFEPQMELAK